MTARLPPLPAAARTASPAAPVPDARDRVAAAALRALAYADVFGFPLAPAEVHRYLAGVSAPLLEVARALDRLVSAGTLRTADGLFALADGTSDLLRRQQLASACDRSWRRALEWGVAIARLPFVRMVAVTGALAADNPDGIDLDYFVVTARGRLWTCRALIIQLVVRPARVLGDVVCPNYLLAEDRLAIVERDGFVARELAQMVPVAGLDVYHQLRAANRWAAELLPNAGGPPPRAATREPHLAGRALARGAERRLRGKTGDALERFEMRRKIRELERRHGAERPEVELGEGCCKGHYSEHGRRVLSAWRQRLAVLGLGEVPDSTEAPRTERAPAQPSRLAEESR